MATLPFLLTSSVSLFFLLNACATGSSSPSRQTASDNPLYEGGIDYPFAEESRTIGRDAKADKLVIKSTVGAAEYELQIPGAARDYDIEVPLADMRRIGATNGFVSDVDPNIKPQTIDNEFVKDMPKLEDPDDRALVEGAFGLGHADGPRQAPSYTLRINKINRYYLNRQYELALIEINDLLSYFPTSIKLYKMKGTILIKTRNFRMAELAWARGVELAPDDLALRRGLEALRKRMYLEQQSAPVQNPTATTAH